MGLSSLHLDAFYAAARSLSFSQAAKELHITQSALSQRIKALEEDVGLTFFVRMARGVQLTATGERLLRYCQARHSLEAELLEELRGPEHGLGGALRIAAAPSLLRSVLVPALAPLLRENPGVQLQMHSGETRALTDMLLGGAIDLLVTDAELSRTELQAVELGHEHHVLIESAEHATEGDLLLDRRPDDPTAQRFFEAQSTEPPRYRRSFVDDTYAILDAVALGLGKAVVPRQLVAGDPRLRVAPGCRPLAVPVRLYHHRQPFYTTLHHRVVDELSRSCPARLRA